MKPNKLWGGGTHTKQEMKTENKVISMKPKTLLKFQIIYIYIYIFCMTCFVFAYKLFSERDHYQLVCCNKLHAVRFSTFMNLQSCTWENKLCGCLKLLLSNYKPTGPQLASVHFHAIFVHFLYFRENWTWIKLVPSTRQNMWQTHQKTREREREIGTL